MKGENCGRCRFWKEIDGGPDGWCLRFPPTVVVEPDYGGGGGPAWYPETNWPETSAGEWCGEFAPATVDASLTARD
jgi:hypothetical protein